MTFKIRAKSHNRLLIRAYFGKRVIKASTFSRANKGSSKRSGGVEWKYSQKYANPRLRLGFDELSRFLSFEPLLFRYGYVNSEKAILQGDPQTNFKLRSYFFTLSSQLDLSSRIY